MIHRREQNCRACLHYLGDEKCLAFPDGIPAELWSGDNLHRQAFPGDQGYRYERKFVELPQLPDDFFDDQNSDAHTT
jgi:hypothetical protein